jgi:hypothetical protein
LGPNSRSLMASALRPLCSTAINQHDRNGQAKTSSWDQHHDVNRPNLQRRRIALNA